MAWILARRTVQAERPEDGLAEQHFKRSRQPGFENLDSRLLVLVVPADKVFTRYHLVGLFLELGGFAPN